MLGGIGNLTNLLKSAKDMQEKFGRMQEEMARQRHEGDAGGGMVRATVDGKGTLVDIKIQPDAVTDIELLEDLVKGAVSVATSKAHNAAKEHMEQLAGGLNIPGLNEMLGSWTS